MFFFTHENNKKAIPALHRKDVNKNHIKYIGTCLAKRTFHRHSLRGSMTVEAALVVPMVFFVWAACIALTSVAKVHENVQNTLMNVALQLSITAGKDEESVKNTGILAAVTEIMTMENLETGGVNKVHGFDFLESSVLKDGETILLKVKYRIQLMEGVIPIPELQLVNQVYVRAWTGESGRDNANEGQLKQDFFVYVSEHGQVYHTDALCSHIRLKIFMVNQSEAVQYEPCDKCIHDGRPGGSTYYITETGRCYHSRLGCSGLKRQVDCVLMTEAKTKGFRPCSRCAGGD